MHHSFHFPGSHTIRKQEASIPDTHHTRKRSLHPSVNCLKSCQISLPLPLITKQRTISSFQFPGSHTRNKQLPNTHHHPQERSDICHVAINCLKVSNECLPFPSTRKRRTALLEATRPDNKYLAPTTLRNTQIHVRHAINYLMACQINIYRSLQ